MLLLTMLRNLELILDSMNYSQYIKFFFYFRNYQINMKTIIKVIKMF